MTFVRCGRHVTRYVFFFSLLSLSLSGATICIFFLQMMDGQTKIGPLAITFFSVQLVETGKAISERQEPSRTDLEPKYYPGLLEIEAPRGRAQGTRMILVDVLLLVNAGQDRRDTAKAALPGPRGPRASGNRADLAGHNSLLRTLNFWV